jgi:hypothetical protein
MARTFELLLYLSVMRFTYIIDRYSCFWPCVNCRFQTSGADERAYHFVA